MNKLLQVAIKSALKAGEEILKIYNDPNSDFSVEKKADNSPLTIADKISHKSIVSDLETTQIPILSEEGADIPYEERVAWSSFWCVDPIDGTKEFIKKNGEFTVNIALIKNNQPVIGVIYVPVSSELYYGVKGGGAKKVEATTKSTFEEIKNKAINLPLENKNKVYKVVGSRSFMNKDTEDFIDALKLENSPVEIVSKGSSLKICMVAEGTANIYPRFGPTMEWDTAAGNAIAVAAGKRVTLTDGETPLAYNKENLLNPYFIVK